MNKRVVVVLGGAGISLGLGLGLFAADSSAAVAAKPSQFVVSSTQVKAFATGNGASKIAAAPVIYDEVVHGILEPDIIIEPVDIAGFHNH